MDVITRSITMKKWLAVFFTLFAFNALATANESAFAPLLVRMTIKYPNVLGTEHPQGLSTSECNAVLYDERGYFAIKKEAPCVKAYENAEYTKAYQNIFFTFENPNREYEPFFYESEDIDNGRVKDEGDYYTFYITPKFMKQHDDLQAQFSRALESFGGALTPQQIVQALSKTKKPAEDKGIVFFENI